MIVTDRSDRPLEVGVPARVWPGTARATTGVVVALLGDRMAEVVLDDDPRRVPEDGPEVEARDLAALKEHGPSVAAGTLLVDPLPRTVVVGGELLEGL